MKIKKFGEITLLVILLIGFTIGNYFLMPLPQVPNKEEVAVTEFSAELAMEHIQRIAQKPRPAGSAYNGEVRQYIKSYIENLGLTVEEDIHTVKHKYEDRMVEVHNLIVKLEGSDTTGTVLYMSHYDSVDEGPGANDNASGVSIMLELLKSITASSQVSNDVMFLFTDGEEYGILGSNAYVGNQPVDEIALVINLEARGNKGRSMLFETHENNYGMVSEFINASSMPYGYSFINDIYKILPNYTDYEPFKNSDVQGLNLAYIEGLDVYHSEQDNIDSVTLETLQHHGQNAYELAQHFGNVDFRSINAEEDTAVYFNLLGYQMMLYSADNNILLSFIALLLVAVVMFISWRKEVTTLRKIGSWLFTLCCLSIVAFLVGVALLLGKAIFDGLISLQVTLIIVWICVIVLAVTIFIIVKWSIWSRWKARVSELTLLDIILPNLLVGIILIGLSCLYTPSSNYLFVIPVIIQSIAMILYYMLRTNRVIQWVGSLTIFPILLILFPLWLVIGLSIGWMGTPFLLIIALITAPYLVPTALLPYNKLDEKR